MIKEKQIAEVRPVVRFQNGADIDLNTIRDALNGCAQGHGIELAFDNDQIKFGGLIGGTTVDCLVLYHPNHRTDYFNFLIVVKKQGNYAFVSVYGSGESKQMKKLDNAADAKAGAASVGKKALHGIMNGDNSIGGMFTGAWGMAKGSAGLVKSIAKGIGSIGGSKEKLEAEKNWYAMVNDVMDEIIA